MKKIVLLFSGEGSNAQNIVKELHNKECEVVCGITNKKDAPGIVKLEALDVECRILEHTSFASREAFDAELVALIKSYEPDLVVLSGFMRILTEVFTSQVQSINLHPSLLPKYKGAKAIEQSYESGDKECGVSVHWVNSELDGGKIILQKSFVRQEGESYESFVAKIKALEYEIMPEAIRKVLQ
ncbi:MAG: phosphoribosylglycinamide formyltransferase [Sulfurimonas sp.]|jgi:phosphoribosylglycinamide formyltransferase-1|nr:phosphoribosylglycinamide formyltransferase [Sulfurimonas sp.]